MGKRLFAVILLFSFLSSSIKSQDIEKKLQSLHTLTFKPVIKENSQEQITFEEIKESLKKGKRANLEGKVVGFKEGTEKLALSAQLPEGHTGTLLVNVPALICSGDNHAYPERGASEVYFSYKVGIYTQDTIGVSYCPPNHKRKEFNFGQKEDQQILAMFLEELAQKNPAAKIRLSGICAGGTAILNTLAQSEELLPNSSKQIDAVVVQSPGISAQKTWDDMGDNYLGSVPLFGNVLKSIFVYLATWWFPKTQESKTEQEALESFKDIPARIALYLAALEKDPVTPKESVEKIYKALNRENSTFEVFNEGVKHGKLSPNKKYQAAVIKFLQDCDKKNQ